MLATRMMYVLNSNMLDDHADRVHRFQLIIEPSNVILLSMSSKPITNTKLGVPVQKKYVSLVCLLAFAANVP